jgi:pimeloyl-ACP methyl ester carboxylesterase
VNVPEPHNGGEQESVMPDLARPDGATIHFEVFGRGFPLLLIAPGGVSSQIESWTRSPINPIEELEDAFMVIAMDQRYAGRSRAPATPFSYDQTAADQIAVLDAAGAEQAHVIAAGAGCGHAWRLAQDAPGRITAIVAQDPVGIDGTKGPGRFYRGFHETMRVARAEGMAAVVRAAQADPVFATNHAAGPFAQRIHDDPAFREEIRRMPVENYVALIVRFRDGIWPATPPFFTVAEEWLAGCPTPMLVLPGSDECHPSGVARRLCCLAPRARCLDPEWRGPRKLAATLSTVRAFLLKHVPS